MNSSDGTTPPMAALPPSDAAPAMASTAAAAAHAARLGLPRIHTRDDALQHEPPSLDAYRAAASREPDDCAPALWYWQMTGLDWDRQTRTYRLQRMRHERLAASDAQRQAEASRDQKRDRSERDRPAAADDSIRRQEQLAAQRKADDALLADLDWRADAPRRARQKLFAALLNAAGLDMSAGLHGLYVPHGLYTACDGATGSPLCIHCFLDIDKAALEMTDPDWVEDLIVCCEKYLEFLDDRTSLRYEEWLDLKVRCESSLQYAAEVWRTHPFVPWNPTVTPLPAYTEPDNTLEEEDSDDEAEALEMRVRRVLCTPARRWARSLPRRPTDDDLRAAMVCAIRPAQPLNETEVCALLAACDLFISIDRHIYENVIDDDYKLMLRNMSDDEYDMWAESHQSAVCWRLGLAMERHRAAGHPFTRFSSWRIVKDVPTPAVGVQCTACDSE